MVDTENFRWYYKNPPRNSGGFFIGKMAEILTPAERKMKKISKKVLTMHLQCDIL